MPVVVIFWQIRFLDRYVIKQIICINWGTKYGAPYVNRLYAMVAKYNATIYIYLFYRQSRRNSFRSPV